MKKTATSIILVIALCISFAIPAMAAPVNETGNVETVDNYKMEFLPNGSLKLIGAYCTVLIEKVEKVTIASIDGPNNYLIWLPPTGTNMTITFASADAVWKLSPDSEEWWMDYFLDPDYFEKFDWGKRYILLSDDRYYLDEDGKYYSEERDMTMIISEWFNPNLTEVSDNNTTSMTLKGTPDCAEILRIHCKTEFNDIGFLYTMRQDAPSSWAQEQVNAAIAAELVPSNMQYSYALSTTRAEFAELAVILYEKLKGQITKSAYSEITFSDTMNYNVRKAAAIGVVSGVGDNRFAPNDPLTREQAATMLSRLANAIGKPLAAQAATFSDMAQVSSWALEAVGQMQSTGIMGGVGENTFAPKNDYTREQSIMTLYRLYNYVK